MTKIISANFVKNEAHCIEMMLDSVQPYVSESYVLIDRATTDNTKEICEARGCITGYFDFENFGKVWNTLLYEIKGKSDWTIFIAPDETINPDFGEMLYPLSEKMKDTNIVGVWFPRRHWEDLDKRVEYTKQNWYPDWQMRFLRNDFPRIHMRNYVHEWPNGLRETIKIENKEIHHYNMYWKPRIDYNFEEMNALYERLKRQQKVDGGGNVWPDAMEIK
jgi:hypothetical protein